MRHPFSEKFTSKQSKLWPRHLSALIQNTGRRLTEIQHLEHRISLIYCSISIIWDTKKGRTVKKSEKPLFFKKAGQGKQKARQNKVLIYLHLRSVTFFLSRDLEINNNQSLRELERLLNLCTIDKKFSCHKMLCTHCSKEHTHFAPYAMHNFFTSQNVWYRRNVIRNFQWYKYTVSPVNKTTQHVRNFCYGTSLTYYSTVEQTCAPKFYRIRQYRWVWGGHERQNAQ